MEDSNKNNLNGYCLVNLNNETLTIDSPFLSYKKNYIENNNKYNKDIQYNNDNKNTFPLFVKLFYEFNPNSNDFLTDYSVNNLTLTNNGVYSSLYGAYFPTNEDVNYKDKEQGDLRRLELINDEIFNSITNQYSISFNFHALEYNNVLVCFSNNCSSISSLTIGITSTGYIQSILIKDNLEIFNLTDQHNIIQFNQEYHFNMISKNGTTSIYLNNNLITSINKDFSFASCSFNNLTLGCMKVCNQNNQYLLPYSGYINKFLLINQMVGDKLRDSIYQKDYGYDIIMLGGQSNMTGAGFMVHGIDDNYTDLINRVDQYDFNTDSIIPARNQLKHYLSDNNKYNDEKMGAWLEFSKKYIKYYLKSKTRKMLLIPCGLGGSSFENDWRTDKPMLNNLINNTNNCLHRNKLNRISCFLWYQGESEVSTKNSELLNDLETFRKNLLTKIENNQFNNQTPWILTLINNKKVVENEIENQSANQFVNNTLINFSNKYDNIGYVSTCDLKLNEDCIHLDSNSLRIIGNRWFNKLCELSKVDNKSIPIISTVDNTEMFQLNVNELNVNHLNLKINNEYDLSIEDFEPIYKVNNGNIFNFKFQVAKAFYQPKTNDIWLLPKNTLLSIKYFNIQTKNLYNRTDWPMFSSNSTCCCFYNDKIYAIESFHSVEIENNSVHTPTILYIIDTLSYSIETRTNFAIKTSNITNTNWKPPENSSQNVNYNTITSHTYSSMFAFGNKLYFIPLAQQDIGIYNLITKEFDQVSLRFDHNGGYFGSVYNPTNRCLYLSKAYKVGNSSNWSIDYLNFSECSKTSNNIPTFHSIILSKQCVGFKSGTYCFTNNSVYIPISLSEINSSNNFILKIQEDQKIIYLNNLTNSQTKFDSILYTLNNQIILSSSSNGQIYFLNPIKDSIEAKVCINTDYLLQCFDKYGTLYFFSNKESSSYVSLNLPITIYNHCIFHPTFNTQR